MRIVRIHTPTSPNAGQFPKDTVRSVNEPEIADSLLDLVGNTPMVRLGRVGRDLRCDLVARVETFNPGGRGKERPAVAMLDAAQRAA